jgi:hypothetical protein
MFIRQTAALVYPILLVINITTRKLYGRILKNKTSRSVDAAFESILEQVKAEEKPFAVVECDPGSEFVSKSFASLCKRNNVELVLTQAGNKRAMAVVERVNRTLRTFIEKLKANRIDWTKSFDELLAFYNQKKHSSTKRAPDSVTEKEEVKMILRAQKRRIPAEEQLAKFPEGTKVRITTDRDIFSKTQPRFTKETFAVLGREGNLLKIENRAKLYSPNQLLRVPETTESFEAPSPTSYPSRKEISKGLKLNRLKKEIGTEVEVREPRRPRVPERLAPAPTPARRRRKLHNIEEIRGHKRKDGTLYLLVKYEDDPEESFQSVRTLMPREGYPEPVGEYLTLHKLFRDPSVQQQMAQYA